MGGPAARIRANAGHLGWGGGSLEGVRLLTGGSASRGARRQRPPRVSLCPPPTHPRPPRSRPGHSPQLRNCSGYCAPGVRGAAELVVQPQQQIQEAVEPRAATGLAPRQPLQRAAAAPWLRPEPPGPGLRRPLACPPVGPSVDQSAGGSASPPPPSRPPRCHRPSAAARALTWTPLSLSARPRRTGRCAPANGRRDWSEGGRRRRAGRGQLPARKWGGAGPEE